MYFGIWRYSYLLRFQAGGHPRILLQGTARVVVGGGIPLEVEHELGDGLLHLQRHNCHDVLFLGALTVKANLPARGRERKKEEFPSELHCKRETAEIPASRWPAATELSHFFFFMLRHFLTKHLSLLLAGNKKSVFAITTLGNSAESGCQTFGAM